MTRHTTAMVSKVDAANRREAALEADVARLKSLVPDLERQQTELESRVAGKTATEQTAREREDLRARLADAREQHATATENLETLRATCPCCDAAMAGGAA